MFSKKVDVLLEIWADSDREINAALEAFDYNHAFFYGQNTMLANSQHVTKSTKTSKPKVSEVQPPLVHSIVLSMDPLNIRKKHNWAAKLEQTLHISKIECRLSYPDKKSLRHAHLYLGKHLAHLAR